MKVGDTLVVEKLTWRVSAYSKREIVLRRCAPMAIKTWRAWLRANRWRRMVSANFLIDARTGKTVTSYELMAMGLPVDRINRLMDTLPVLEPHLQQKYSGAVA